MKTNKQLRKLFLASWLTTRLLSTIEKSWWLLRKMKPEPRFQRAARINQTLTPTEWIFEPPFLYTLTLDKERDNFIFTKVSEIASN